MTPTLFGRWQSRILLMGTVGVALTLLFGIAFRDLLTPYVLLGYVLLIGLVGDVIYDRVQNMRWEHDFPPFMHLLTGILEGAVMWALIQSMRLPLVPADLPFINFIAHYATVFSLIFIIAWGPLKIVLPQQRYKAGRVV